MKSDLPDAVMSLSSDYRKQLANLFEGAQGDTSWKLQNFTNYVPRQAITRFLCREEMFRQVLHTQGCILECGVFGGWGVMAWLQLSAIFEPLNNQRRIIGFDTFEGFPSVAPEDTQTGQTRYLAPGDLAMGTDEEIRAAADLYTQNMFIKNPDKVALVKGDACKTIPEFIEKNPEIIVSLMYLDFDLYEPTKVALEHFLPRMPKGSILAFDELNDRGYPGETIAFLESQNVNNFRIQRFAYDTKTSYAILE